MVESDASVSRSRSPDLAHDLRNALSVILGYTQLIERRRQRAGFSPDPGLTRALEAIERAKEQAEIALAALEVETRATIRDEAQE